MAWFKTDDKLPDNRKARAVRKSHADKRRDVAPFGIWVLAGAWSDDGFVPLEVLEDWDDDAKTLADRLVKAGMWHKTKRNGEPGYVFHDWADHNPARDDNDPSKSGTFGNHMRWHVQRQMVMADCDHCPREPETEPEPIGANRGDIAPDSGTGRGESLPSRPDPTRSRPVPDPTTSSDKSDKTDPLARFDEFWDTYAKKVKRADAEKKWIKALGKASADRIIAAAAAYVTHERANNQGGRFIADPSTWLHGERWRDERSDLPAPKSRAAQWLQLAEELTPQEPANIRQIGPSR
jgi:hypothetical protein